MTRLWPSLLGMTQLVQRYHLTSAHNDRAVAVFDLERGPSAGSPPCRAVCRKSCAIKAVVLAPPERSSCHLVP
jgi:hypothetical protein